MTYLEAVTIEQKFMVRLEFAETIGREKLKIVEDVAAGFTKEQLAEALIVLKNKKQEEMIALTALFALAIRSKQ